MCGRSRFHKKGRIERIRHVNPTKAGTCLNRSVEIDVRELRVKHGMSVPLLQGSPTWYPRTLGRPHGPRGSPVGLFILKIAMT